MEFDIKSTKKNKIKIEKPKNFKVLMYNDDFTTMEFVVDILSTIFNKSIEDANKIMLEVHNKGIGIAGIYPYDIALTKLTVAMKMASESGFPFKLTVEEE